MSVDPGVVAVAAVIVTLLLGIITPALTLYDSRKKAQGEQSERRAEAYVDLLRIVERRGLAVQDEMFNYTETGAQMYEPGPSFPKRPVEMPPRTDRAEARALAAAYGTAEVRRDVTAWIKTIEAWEAKLSNWHFEFDANGEDPAGSPEDAEPERTNELDARDALGVSVSAALRVDP